MAAPRLGPPQTHCGFALAPSASRSSDYTGNQTALSLTTLALLFSAWDVSMRLVGACRPEWDYFCSRSELLADGAHLHHCGRDRCRGRRSGMLLTDVPASQRSLLHCGPNFGAHCRPAAAVITTTDGFPLQPQSQACFVPKPQHAGCRGAALARPCCQRSRATGFPCSRRSRWHVNTA